MGFTLSHVWLATVVLLAGCSFSLGSSQNDEQCSDPGHQQCVNGGVRTCTDDEDDSTYLAFESCDSNACVTLSDTTAMCALPGATCDADAWSVCIGNDAHDCVNTLVAANAHPCGAERTCLSGAGPLGRSKAVCAIDSTPCKDGVDKECRGNVVVRCDGGLPVGKLACDSDQRCLEGELGGSRTAECAAPIDCPAPGTSACIDNSVYICSDVFPRAEAVCGNGFCLDVNGWPACYAASDGPAPLAWQPLPAGSFAVGSKLLGDARPQATVASFELLKTEVTTAQYRACITAGGCAQPPADAAVGFSSGQGDFPIVSVTADEAKAFCAWAGGTLPTELEWEYAQRNGGADVLYPWGDDALICESAAAGADGQPLLPGCSRAPDITTQGVCDLAGNVSEWVLAEPPMAGMTGVRGTYYDGLKEPTARTLVADDERSVLRGFRCARH